MSRIALLAAVAFAALTGTAHAGGWATVELGEMPSGLVAGEPWQVELIVKQHGITPLAGVTPSVRITNGAGVVTHFPRAPDRRRSGTYVAEVTFPAGGEWKTRLYDGFTDAVPHRLVAADRRGAGGERRPRPGDFPWHADDRDRHRRAAVPRRRASRRSTGRGRGWRHGTVTLRGRAA